jgi:hypothetical protein
MPFQKGQVAGRNGGRKSKAEEFKLVIADLKEDIEQDVINKLARKKIFQVLEQGNDYGTLKEFTLPILIKSMGDKIDHTTKGESLNKFTDEDIMLAQQINAQRNARTNITSEGSTAGIVGGEVSDKK